MPTPVQKMLLLFGRYDPALYIYTAADNTSTFDPSWTFSAGGGPMTVDWGDGSARESHATALSHTYANGSTKRVKFTCPNWAMVTGFDVRNDVCKFALPYFSRLYNLTDFKIMGNQFSGTIPSSVLLTSYAVNSNLFSGTIPSFAACVSLSLWYGDDNRFDGYKVGGFATQKSLSYLTLQTNKLPAAAIDAILADLVTSLAIGGRVQMTLVNLSGVGNAAPSNPAGLASKAALVAAGWTVTTN